MLHTAPQTHAYNAIIDGLCKVNRTFEAFVTLEEMIKIGISPTAFTYTILIEQLLKEGKIDRACEMYNQMISLNCKLDTHAFVHDDCVGEKLLMPKPY